MKTNTNQSHIFIPMAVRALPVGKPSRKTHFSGFNYDMTQLGNVYRHTESSLFAEISEDRTPGIYLHWSLPACFTSGIQDPESGEITYQLAPNRFSVTRLWTATGEILQSKTFLVESDVLYPDRTPENLNSPSIPWAADNERPYRFQGRSFDSDQPPADYPYNGPFIRLTATAQSSPFFVAYAPACQNVFGFVDPVADDGLTNVTLSYVICGWYQEHTEPEPCSLIKNLEELEEIMGLTLEGDELPHHALCHGIIKNIAWSDAEHIYPTGTPSDPESGEIVTMPVLGVGNTSAEAMAALLDPPTMNGEHMLHHYLSDNAGELDHYYGIAQADSRIKQSHFYADPPVTLQGLRTDKTQETMKCSVTFFDLLRDLRNKQRDLQFNYGCYVQKQRLVYEKWYLHYYSDNPSDSQRYKQEMQDALTDADNLGLALVNAQADIQALEKQLARQFPYTLQEESEDAFYTPVDPVVVTAQIAPKTAKADSDPELLPCRVKKQLINGFSLKHIDPFKTLPTDTVLKDSDLAVSELLKLESAYCPTEDISACVAECIFLSEAFSVYLAHVACKKADIPASEAQIKRIASYIEFSQKNRDSSFMGHFPDKCALTEYHASWSPLIAEWEVYYYPDPDILCAEPSLKNWTLTQGDYTFHGELSKICTIDNRYPIGGRFFISDNASHRLMHTIQNHSTENSLYAQAREMQYLSQTLDGFHKKMLMRDSTIAMDFFSKDSAEKKMIEQLQTLLPDVLTDRPVFDALFSPIRAGFFELRRIRLIDAMGYYQDIDNPLVYAGEGLRVPDSDNRVRYVMLPPRLIQPLMLSAFFADASQTMISESFPTQETSPVCGYLVANYLNHSIRVYTAQGIHVCSVSLTQSGTDILLQNAPLMPETPVPPSDLDPQMTSFLKGLLSEGPKALTDLLSLIDQRHLQIRTGDQPYYSANYFGCPIALLRLSLRLILYGEPEVYRHVDGRERDKSGSTDITALSIPVQVGQPDNPLDGVYGFFENENYRRFHGFPGIIQDSSYIMNSNQISLSLKKESPSQTLTLLMDPYAEANLVTGILPVKTLRIPQNLATQGLDANSASYFSAPVLYDDTLSGIPIPHTDSLEYYWVTVTKDNQKDIRPLTPSDLSAAFPSERFCLQDGYVVVKEKEEVTN